MEKIVIIDGNSLINRAFYAMPLLSNSEGLYLNAVYGFANMLCKIITECKPTKIAVCFDMGKPTFRHLKNKDYKATRKGMPQELAEQMPILKEMLSKMNIKYIEKEGFEADDLIGSLARKFVGEKIIISGDKDLFQLINKDTTVWHTKRGVTDYAEMNEKSLMETMGIEPYQIVELKALMGDTSDNIKGVQGIGEKTALNLVKTYQNIDNLYLCIDNITGKMKEKLIQGEEDARESKWLATIKTDVDIDKNIEDFNYTYPFTSEVYELFKNFEFKTITKRTTLFDLSQKIEKKEIDEISTFKIEEIKSLEDFDKLKSIIEKDKFLTFHIDKDIHICTGTDIEYIVVTKKDLLDTDGFEFIEVLDLLKDLLKNEKIKKVVYDSKHLKHTLKEYNYEINGIDFDVSLCEYLVNCGTKIAESLSELLENKNYNSKNFAYGLLKLKKLFQNQLKELNMESLYYDIELPLVDCLFDMETTGIQLDKNELETLKENFLEEIKIISEDIFSSVGKKFNLNSPKQLAEVLFVDLGLPNRKKNSTASEVLMKLLGYHPIIEYIMEYRKIFKILGYVEAFLEKMDKKDNKLHTIYQQKLTTTGRLSSIEPNLQNVPVRDEIGKKLRKAFISSFEDGYLISSDYSQIELKLLANFSKDEKLLYAYNNNIDIHTKTASEIFGIDKDLVSQEMRKKAKAINFGIIYGISDFGLSETINSSILEAKEYIKSYFRAFPSIENYLNGLVEKATEKGYAITYFNRRRKIQELSSSNFNIKSFGKRVSMNMPLQGTASDIIKIAMNKVYCELKTRNLKSKLLLQIHDELIVDCPKEEFEEVKVIIKNCMENVLKLDIPLTCDISYGKNWLEAL